MVALGDYEVGRILGEGATGRVRLGRHKSTGELVALKIVPANFVSCGGPVSQAVRREIAVLRLIASGDSAIEGVLTLYDVIKTDDSTVLALEYCNGGDLFDILLNEGRLPIHVVRDYFRQLTTALYVCHQRGICHRDLKPENILISSDGSLRIADFGMSGILNPAALLETSCGSPHYCAPEVLLGQRYSGTEADVWSLGVILFAMITGGLPFDDDNLSRLTRKVCAGVFYMPPEIPDEVASLVKQMLVVTPEHRLPLEAVLQCDWIANDGQCYVPLKANGSHPLPPVANPDPEIIAYLADLGLGSDFMIRRRLNGKRSCLEREMYYRFVSVSSKNFTDAKHVCTLTSPTSVTENVFKENILHEQAALEKSLAKMQLSEAFKGDQDTHETFPQATCLDHEKSEYDASVRECFETSSVPLTPSLDIQERESSQLPTWLNIFHAPGNCV